MWNSSFTDRIVKISERYLKLGARVSIEELPGTNDQLRVIRLLSSFNRFVGHCASVRIG